MEKRQSFSTWLDSRMPTLRESWKNLRVKVAAVLKGAPVPRVPVRPPTPSLLLRSRCVECAVKVLISTKVESFAPDVAAP